MLFSTLGAFSQNTHNSRIAYGLFGEYGFDQTNADFSKLQGIPNCCPKFTDGSGNGLTIGGFLTKPMSSQFGLVLRASLMTQSGEMKSEEPTVVIINNTVTNSTFEHVLNGTFTKVGIDPMVYYEPYENLKLNFGMRLAFKVSSTYDQKERLLGPDGSFVDQNNNPIGRTRNVSEGDIPNSSFFNAYGIIGLSYGLPLNRAKSLYFSPTVTYYYDFNSMVSDVSWNINTLRLGLALTYEPSDLIKRKENIFKIDTIYKENSEPIARFAMGAPTNKSETKLQDNVETEYLYTYRTDTVFSAKKYSLSGRIDAFGVDSLGQETESAKIFVEEFISSRTQPLLPYVFFEDNADKIQTKYTALAPGDAKNFEIKSLSKSSTLETYYHILNIVGRRMTEHPAAILRITGCNSGIAVEEDNTELSMRRAEKVKKYLADVWQIDDSRLQLEKRNLPEKASTPIAEQDKIAENRRVELYSEEYEILAPVFLSDTLRKANPPIARFYPKANADAGLKAWTIEAKQKGLSSANFSQAGSANLPTSVDWKFNENQITIPSLDERIDVELTIQDKQLQAKSITTFLPVEYLSVSKKRRERKNDVEIDRYNLILFDFNKYEIEAGNKKIVEHIKKRLQKDSKMTITGYTDRTGDAQHNQKLSQNRAMSAKKALNHANSSALGVGSSKELYDNNIPEGRFYCRTVDIIVETPIK